MDADNGSDQFESLRSDVGIHGLTANIHSFSNYSYLGNDTLSTDGSSELEFVYRDVRMVSERVGVGFQALTSFFVDGPNASFGVGSWGLGPIVRAYPLRTDQFQPYVQANALAGDNLAVSELANTATGGNGFRIRLGLRAGMAFRIIGDLGLFAEVGYDWESSRLFKADARALQANIGIDYYLFN
ncbi:MAG: hypothetical protein U5J63_17525 [Fodinibius sp.]|nr:hypothetical protein [Fodinibius sp.]